MSLEERDHTVGRMQATSILGDEKAVWESPGCLRDPRAQDWPCLLLGAAAPSSPSSRGFREPQEDHLTSWMLSRMS